MDQRDDSPNPNEEAQAPAEIWDTGSNRREAAALGLVAALIAPAALVRSARAATAGTTAGDKSAPKRRFLTPRQRDVLDELSEIIIPTDEHSPGARAARVADDLDGWLADLLPRIPDQKKVRDGFRGGLIEIDRESKRRFKKGFIESSPEERLALVTEMARGEQKAQTPLEKFFVDLKSACAYSYYTSEIGLHQDLQYRGNTYLDDFVGYDLDEALVVPSDRKHNQTKW